MAIELKQAPPQEVNQYIMWFREPEKRQALPYALTLYKMGEVNGQREIEGYPPVSFRANWRVSSLPTDINLCKVTFETMPEEMTYEIQLPNHKLVDFLIDMTKSIHGKGVADFPQGFYAELFRIKI
ncbi:MAG: type IV pilus biogenesis protein EbsA [Pseudanabaenaceae cyanobacterium]